MYIDICMQMSLQC